jgi:hypothetical protein
MPPLRAPATYADGLPDLQPVSLTVSPGGTIYIGKAYTATFTGQNVGSAPTSGTWVDELWLSTDPVYGAGDKFVGDQMWTGGPVAPGATYTLQVTFVPRQRPGPVRDDRHPLSGLAPGPRLLRERARARCIAPASSG